MYMPHIMRMKTTKKEGTPKCIKAELSTDDRAVIAMQGRKLKRQLLANLLNQKVKYSRPPKEANTTELTPTLITLCFQCHLLPLKK